MKHDHWAEARAWAFGSGSTAFWIWMGIPIWAAVFGGVCAPFLVILAEHAADRMGRAIG